MNTLKSNPTLLKPEVLLQFRLCPDANHPTDTPLAPDAWVDFDTAFGPQFQLGTEHNLIGLSPERQAHRYVVAKTPFLHQIPAPPGLPVEKISLATLYLEPVS